MNLDPFKKNLASYSFVTFFNLLCLKIDVNVPGIPTQIMQKQKFRGKLVGNFKATEEKSRIRILIRNPVLVPDLYKNVMVPNSWTANWYKKFSRAKEGQCNDPHVHINGDIGKQKQKKHTLENRVPVL
jgi:hypothetical protein